MLSSLISVSSDSKMAFTFSILGLTNSSGGETNLLVISSSSLSSGTLTLKLKPPNSNSLVRIESFRLNADANLLIYYRLLLS